MSRRRPEAAQSASGRRARPAESLAVQVAAAGGYGVVATAVPITAGGLLDAGPGSLPGSITLAVSWAVSLAAIRRRCCP